MKKRLFPLLTALLLGLLLSGCSKYTYNQKNIGDPPAVIDETTILGTWYFEGQADQSLVFNEDLTYSTFHGGTEGFGSYSLSEDYMTLHLKEETSGIDDDVSVLYGDGILYLRWRPGREQIFTREIKK